MNNGDKKSGNHSASSQIPVIDIDNISISFGNNHVLKKFSLQVYQGENVAVLGKSGSGKSVLIKCIIGLLEPDSGNIKVEGTSVLSFTQPAMDKMRVHVGFLFQSNALYDSMTVRENLEFPLRRHWMDKSRKEIDDLVMDALDNVGLRHAVDRMPAELSGGMRKRIALARTLILKPEIILYDEPTTGLDPITGREISALICTLQKKYGTTSIIISHDMNCVKMTANRIAILHEGRCYATGTWNELIKSDDKIIHDFFETT